MAVNVSPKIQTDIFAMMLVIDKADPGVLPHEGDAVEETGVVDGVEGRRLRIGEVKVVFSLAVLILDKFRSISSMRSLTTAAISKVSEWKVDKN